MRRCFVLFGIVWLWALFGCTALTSEAYHAFRLSDDGYGDDIRFLQLQAGAIRTRYVFTASVRDGDRCGAFYDLAFLFDDNQLKHLADIGVAKLPNAMRLVQSPNWHFRPYPDSTVLRKNLQRSARGAWAGMSTTLVHSGRFEPTDGPPRKFVRGADAQDCYFDVAVQYFIKLDAPNFIHIMVVDATPSCGSRLLHEPKFKPKALDRDALRAWIDGFGIERDQQRALNELLAQPSAGVQSLYDIRSIRETDTYRDAVEHCRRSLGDGR